jgi:hypothetical protein
LISKQQSTTGEHISHQVAWDEKAECAYANALMRMRLCECAYANAQTAFGLEELMTV